MMMSLCAVQVGATAGSTNGSITVSNATDDKTYYVFKMLDVTYDASGNYTYTVTSDWVNFFVNNNEITDYVTVTTVGDTYYVKWKNSSSDTTTVQTFAQLALTYAINLGSTKATASAVASNSTATFSDLAIGYYLVTTLESGSLVELDTTDNSMTVVDKNAKPTITKSVYNTTSSTYTGSNTAGYSDTVTYQVKLTGIDELDQLILHDTLPTGFKLGTITVDIYDYQGSTTTLVLNTDYTTPTTTDGCSFEVNFAKLLEQTGTSSNYYTYVTNVTYPAQSYLVVTYTATIDSSANVVSDTTTTNTNTAYATASTIYESGSKDTAKVTASTTIYDFWIYKYDSTNQNTYLSGAEFTLTNASDQYAYFTESSGVYSLAGWTSDTSTLDTQYTYKITSDSDGLVHVKGLDVGTYSLTEITAPTGYAMSTSSVSVVVSSDGSVTANGTTADQDKVSGSYTVMFANSTSEEMPTTGGIGTTIFYVVGGVLVIGAVILLITKKRMNGEDK